MKAVALSGVCHPLLPRRLQKASSGRRRAGQGVTSEARVLTVTTIKVAASLKGVKAITPYCGAMVALIVISSQKQKAVVSRISHLEDGLTLTQRIIAPSTVKRDVIPIGQHQGRSICPPSPT